MKAKKILFITQEMVPFVPETASSKIGRYLPQAIQEMGHEIRTFTPKWGIINERRNQLHEVIRLSGMNLIIDDTDHPLIIKVSSIQAARMQIYFIDNDDFFMKRSLAHDENGTTYDDNGERAIFYARGVLETVKKLRWTPDVIFCQGWVSALAPLYIKKAFADEPSFCDTKVVFAIDHRDFEGTIGANFHSCIPFKDVTMKDIEEICGDAPEYDNLIKFGIKYCDGIIFEDEEAQQYKPFTDYIAELGKPTLECQPEGSYEAYSTFFESMMDDEE